MTHEEVIARALQHAESCGVPVEKLRNGKVREAYVVKFQAGSSDSKVQFLLDKATGEFITAQFSGPEFAPRAPTSKQFSVRAQRVLALASQESRSLGHDYVGSEHLLLGALAYGKGIGADCLTGAGLSIEAVRGYVATAGFVPEQVQSGYTASMRSALKASGQSAASLPAPEIEPEHLILGLLAEAEGGATSTLQHFRVGAQEIRARLFQRLRTESH